MQAGAGDTTDVLRHVIQNAFTSDACIGAVGPVLNDILNKTVASQIQIPYFMSAADKKSLVDFAPHGSWVPSPHIRVSHPRTRGATFLMETQIKSKIRGAKSLLLVGATYSQAEEYFALCDPNARFHALVGRIDPKDEGRFNKGLLQATQNPGPLANDFIACSKNHSSQYFTLINRKKFSQTYWPKAKYDIIVAIDSLYDIPPELVSDYMVQAQTKVLYFTMHMAAEIDSTYRLPMWEIKNQVLGYTWRKQGDEVHFLHDTDSTMGYTHDFETLKSWFCSNGHSGTASQAYWEPMYFNCGYGAFEMYPVANMGTLVSRPLLSINGHVIRAFKVVPFHEKGELQHFWISEAKFKQFSRWIMQTSDLTMQKIFLQYRSLLDALVVGNRQMADSWDLMEEDDVEIISFCLLYAAAHKDYLLTCMNLIGSWLKSGSRTAMSFKNSFLDKSLNIIHDYLSHKTPFRLVIGMSMKEFLEEFMYCEKPVVMSRYVEARTKVEPSLPIDKIDARRMIRTTYSDVILTASLELWKAEVHLHDRNSHYFNHSVEKAVSFLPAISKKTVTLLGVAPGGSLMEMSAAGWTGHALIDNNSSPGMLPFSSKARGPGLTHFEFIPIHDITRPHMWYPQIAKFSHFPQDELFFSDASHCSEYCGLEKTIFLTTLKLIDEFFPCNHVLIKFVNLDIGTLDALWAMKTMYHWDLRYSERQSPFSYEVYLYGKKNKFFGPNVDELKERVLNRHTFIYNNWRRWYIAKEYMPRYKNAIPPPPALPPPVPPKDDDSPMKKLMARIASLRRALPPSVLPLPPPVPPAAPIPPVLPPGPPPGPPAPPVVPPVPPAPPVILHPQPPVVAPMSELDHIPPLGFDPRFPIPSAPPMENPPLEVPVVRSKKSVIPRPKVTIHKGKKVTFAIPLPKEQVYVPPVYQKAEIIKNEWENILDDFIAEQERPKPDDVVAQLFPAGWEQKFLDELDNALIPIPPPVPPVEALLEIPTKVEAQSKVNFIGLQPTNAEPSTPVPPVSSDPLNPKSEKINKKTIDEMARLSLARLPPPVQIVQPKKDQIPSPKPSSTIRDAFKEIRKESKEEEEPPMAVLDENPTIDPSIFPKVPVTKYVLPGVPLHEPKLKKKPAPFPLPPTKETAPLMHINVPKDEPSQIVTINEAKLLGEVPMPAEDKARLEKMGLYTFPTIPDGYCVARAVALGLGRPQSAYVEIMKDWFKSGQINSVRVKEIAEKGWVTLKEAKVIAKFYGMNLLMNVNGKVEFFTLGNNVNGIGKISCLYIYAEGGLGHAWIAVPLGHPTLAPPVDISEEKFVWHQIPLFLTNNSQEQYAEWQGAKDAAYTNILSFEDPTGTTYDSHKAAAAKVKKMQLTRKDLRVAIINMAPGAGKTYFVSKKIKSGTEIYITGSRPNRDEMEVVVKRHYGLNAIEIKTYLLKTWAMALIIGKDINAPSIRRVYLDECFRHPDFMYHVYAQYFPAAEFVLLGDPNQMGISTEWYKSTVGVKNLSTFLQERNINPLDPKDALISNVTYRFGPKTLLMLQRMGFTHLRTGNTQEEFIKVVLSKEPLNLKKETWFEMVVTKEQQLRHAGSITVCSAQGVSPDNVVLYIDSAAAAALCRHRDTCLVAFSRHKKKLIIVVDDMKFATELGIADHIKIGGAFDLSDERVDRLMKRFEVGARTKEGKEVEINIKPNEKWFSDLGLDLENVREMAFGKAIPDEPTKKKIGLMSFIPPTVDWTLFEFSDMLTYTGSEYSCNNQKASMTFQVESNDVPTLIYKASRQNAMLKTVQLLSPCSMGKRHFMRSTVQELNTFAQRLSVAATIHKLHKSDKDQPRLMTKEEAFQKARHTHKRFFDLYIDKDKYEKAMNSFTVTQAYTSAFNEFCSVINYNKGHVERTLGQMNYIIMGHLKQQIKAKGFEATFGQKGGQPVSASEKAINVMYSTMFRTIRTLMVSCLKANFLYADGKRVDEVSDWMANIEGWERVFMGDHTEMDTVHTHSANLATYGIFNLFCPDDELLWQYMNVSWGRKLVTNIMNARWEDNLPSGSPETMSKNIIYDMVVISQVFDDPEKIIVAACFLGDDSVVFLKHATFVLDLRYYGLWFEKPMKVTLHSTIAEFCNYLFGYGHYIYNPLVMMTKLLNKNCSDILSGKSKWFEWISAINDRLQPYRQDPLNSERILRAWVNNGTSHLSQAQAEHILMTLESYSAMPLEVAKVKLPVEPYDLDDILVGGRVLQENSSSKMKPNQTVKVQKVQVDQQKELDKYFDDVDQDYVFHNPAEAFDMMNWMNNEPYSPIVSRSGDTKEGKGVHLTTTRKLTGKKIEAIGSGNDLIVARRKAFVDLCNKVGLLKVIPEHPNIVIPLGASGLPISFEEYVLSLDQEVVWKCCKCHNVNRFPDRNLCNVCKKCKTDVSDHLTNVIILAPVPHGQVYVHCWVPEFGFTKENRLILATGLFDATRKPTHKVEYRDWSYTNLPWSCCQCFEINHFGPVCHCCKRDVGDHENREWIYRKLSPRGGEETYFWLPQFGDALPQRVRRVRTPRPAKQAPKAMVKKEEKVIKKVVAKAKQDIVKVEKREKAKMDRVVNKKIQSAARKLPPRIKKEFSELSKFIVDPRKYRPVRLATDATTVQTALAKPFAEQPVGFNYKNTVGRQINSSEWMMVLKRIPECAYIAYEANVDGLDMKYNIAFQDQFGGGTMGNVQLNMEVSDTEYYVNWVYATPDSDTSTYPFQPHGDILLAGIPIKGEKEHGRYLWLDKGSTFNITVDSITGATGMKIVFSFVLMENKGLVALYHPFDALVGTPATSPAISVSGYYALQARMTPTGTDSGVEYEAAIANISAGFIATDEDVFGHHALPDFINNFNAAEASRVTAAAVWFKNRAPEMYKQGTLVAIELPQHKPWTDYIGKFSTVEKYNGKIDTPMAKGMKFFLKTGDTRDFELQRNLITDGGFIADSFWPIDNPTQSVLCYGQVTVQTISGSNINAEDAMLEIAFGVEYQTDDSWRPVGISTMHPNACLDALVELRRIPFAMKNDSHVVQTISSIARGMQDAAEIGSFFI